MKREVQLFISDTRVDLFNDESISITDSIQNVSDISKLFTPFSQQFNLPASQTNNKLFKHYYNFNIQGGFDARFKVDARIEINFVPFKTGKLRLTGVSLKDNKPHTYKVVFFGEPNNLKDIFGDEDLSGLNGLSTYDIQYDNNDFLDAFKTGLQSTGTAATNLSNRNVVVPLISLNTYYTYDTTSTDRLDNVTFTDLRKQLKPAIKLKRVIEAIQTQYDITFNMEDVHLDEKVLAEDTSQVITEASPSEDVILEDATSDIKTFFGSDMFDELYLWLHREKTPITSPETTTKTFGVDTSTRSIKFTLADFTYSSGSGDLLTGGKLVVTNPDSYSIRVALTPSANATTGEIIVKDKSTNELLFFKEDITFQSGVNLSIPLMNLTSGNLSSRTYDIEFRINCQTQETFSSVTMLITKNESTAHNYTATNKVLNDNIFIQDYLPKMKVIDFLSGLFKMFNLVAYKRLGDSTIYVETFDDFMFEGVTRDITKYIDVSQSTIDRPVPYNQVNFNYSKPVTQTSLRFLNQFAQAFGDLEYSAPEKYDGQAFNLQVPFERSVLINLQNSSGVNTNNILGWWVDDAGSTTLGKPFIFFNRVIDQSGGSGSPVTGLNITAYNAPSSVSTDQNHSLNFGAEYDEFNKSVNTNSLFSRFYQNYILQTFNQNARIIKVSARLPVSFILNYRVNDVILIEGQEYYINSIKIDLTTGKSDLDLIVKTVTYTNSVLT
tara:strand:+ start:4310 stop:6472 length:2163 start_codon:yes stop_codon:yes gene_type:complete